MRVWDRSKPPSGPWTLNRDCFQAQGLVAWYPIAGGSGLWLPDHVGSGHMNSGTAPLVVSSSQGGGALSFTSASSHYLEALSAVVTAEPFTMDAWFRSVGNASGGVIACIGTNGSNNRWQLQVNRISSTSQFNAMSVDSGGSGPADSSNTWTDGVWAHGMGVFESTTSRTAYLNGVASSVNTTAKTIAGGINRTLLGARRNSSNVGLFFNGDVADFGVWNYAAGQMLADRRSDPGLRYELYYPLRSKKWIALFSGLSRSITEGANADHSQAQAFGATGVGTEAASASHSQTSSTAQTASITESATAADGTNASATGDYTGTINEASTLSETAAQAFASTAAATEAVTAAESCGVVLGLASSEMAASTLADTSAIVAAYLKSLAESAALAASQERAAFGTFITEEMENGSGSVWTNEDVVWTWFPNGRIGELEGLSPTDGVGTTESDGTLRVAGLPLGQSGILFWSKQNTDATDDDVAYEAGTVT